MNLLRRYGLLVYGLVFAVHATLEGRYASPDPNQADPGYQWVAVIIVWITLALAVFQLHRIIDPRNYSMSSPRFGKAFGFSLLLIVFLFVFFEAPNVPPVVEVPMKFAVVTALLTLVFGIAEAIGIELRKRKAE